MKFKVQSHKHSNTGGHCTVSTFRVWLPDENRTLFVHISDNDYIVSGALATCDYINEEVDYDSKYDVETFDVLRLDNSAKYFELYKYCLGEFAKADCKYHTSTVFYPLHLLSHDITSKMSLRYIEWHKKVVGDMFEHNGYVPVIDDRFLALPQVDFDDERISAVKLLQYMNDELIRVTDPDKVMASDHPFFSYDVSITFGERTFKAKNSSVLFDCVKQCLQLFIDD